MQHSFSVYNASAGSGKTYTLAKEYIKILLLSPKNDAFSGILAITFTNKAVGEMKKRILDYLIAFSEEQIEEENVSFLNDIIHETGLSEDKIFKKSKIVLKTLLQNYANFDISTIDKFTLKLVKNFAFDLGISSQFEVSLDEEYLQEQAIDLMISQTGEDEEITKILIDYAKNQVEDDGNWDLTADIVNVVKLLEKETFRVQMQNIKDKTLDEIIEIKNDLIKQNIDFKNENLYAAQKIQEIINDIGVPEKDFSSNSFPKFLQKILTNDYSKINIKNIDDVKINKTSKFTNDDLPKEVDYFIQIIYKNVNLYNFNLEIIKNLTPLSLLNKVVSKISEIENNQNILLLSKFNELIYNEIITQPALYIYERIGEKYKHFFIDEFQDTSQLQWLNMVPLLDNAVSSEDLSGVKGTVMVVGDPKQSIYRFRGGKPELLIDLSKNDDLDDKKQIPFNTKDKIVVNLDTNYRSYSEVINFNNDFFQFIANDFSNEDYKNLYLNNSFQKQNAKNGGCVSITFCTDDSIETDEELDNNSLMVAHTLLKVKSCKADGFEFGEIAILVNSNKEGVLIAKRLVDEGIKVISAESLLLSSSVEVLTIIKFLQIVHYEKDETVLSQFIYQLHQLNSKLKSSEKSVYQITKDALEFCKNDTLENWLKNYDIFIDIQSLKSKPLYNSVQEIIDILLQNPKNNTYLQTLLEVIWDKSIKSKLNLQEFLEFWERKNEKLSIAASNTSDAVIILSIHKSKGLEFPVVIFPFVNQMLNKIKDPVFLPLENQSIEYGLAKESNEFANVNEEIKNIIERAVEERKMDTINKLYVALTRAKEQLHIISLMKINKGNIISESYISKYFLKFLEHKNILDFNKFEYIFGNLERDSKLKKSKNNGLIIENNYEKLTFNQVKIAKNEALLWGTKQKDAIDFGDFIHNLMQEICTKNDIEKVVKKALQKGNIQSFNYIEIIDTISKIVNHQNLKIYFDENSTIFNEQKIIIPKKSIIIPDRMVFYKDKFYLLDYKTGKKENKHLEQINYYKSVLESMNYSVAQSVLVYINENIEVVNLEDYV